MGGVLASDTVAQIAFLIPFLVAIPMALLFGFSLSSPDSLFNIGIMVLCFGAMLLPIFIRYHQPLLIASWNMPIAFFFLPGSPKLWMVMVLVSLSVLAVSGGLARNLDPNATAKRNHATKYVTWSLFILVGLVMLTASLRGGIGGRAFGSEVYGANKYLPIPLAAMGFFALSRINIPSEQAGRTILFFFSGYLFLAVSNLAYMAGPSFYWLYYIFPTDYAISQAQSDETMSGLTRLSGIAFSMIGVFCYILARFGIRKTMEVRYLPCLLMMLLALGLSTLGGFRSLLGLFFLIFIFQFYYEGLFRSHLFPLFTIFGVILMACCILFVNKMPVSMQRTLSFLPVQVDAMAASDAKASAEWRFRMWSVLWTEVPKYLVVGKGYRLDPADLALFEWARTTHRGHFEDYEEAMVVGNYHSGPLSVLLSFGISGVLAVLFFWGAGIRMLRENLTRGSPELRSINIALLSFFVAHIVFFLFVFGELSTDLPLFCGLLGLSAALNKSSQVT